ARLEGNSVQGTDSTHVELRESHSDSCQATVTRDGRASVLTLTKAELPACEPHSATPVRFIGAWGSIAPTKDSPNYRRLTQIWLWEIDGTARALLLRDIAPSGMRRDFTFVQQLQGKRRSDQEWDLASIDQHGKQESAPLIFTLVDGGASLDGAPLDPQEVVSHPKIALAPIKNRVRFLDYFDNVFFNLKVPWTA